MPKFSIDKCGVEDGEGENEWESIIELPKSDKSADERGVEKALGAFILPVLMGDLEADAELVGGLVTVGLTETTLKSSAASGCTCDSSSGRIAGFSKP